MHILVYPLTSKGGFLVVSPTSRLVMGSASSFSSSSGTSLGEWGNGNGHIDDYHAGSCDTLLVAPPDLSAESALPPVREMIQFT